MSKWYDDDRDDGKFGEEADDGEFDDDPEDDPEDDYVECRNCGADMYEDAVFCPRCGHAPTSEDDPLFLYRRWPWWVMLGLVGAFVVALGWILK